MSRDDGNNDDTVVVYTFNAACFNKHFTTEYETFIKECKGASFILLQEWPETDAGIKLNDYGFGIRRVPNMGLCIAYDCNRYDLVGWCKPQKKLGGGRGVGYKIIKGTACAMRAIFEEKHNPGVCWDVTNVHSGVIHSGSRNKKMKFKRNVIKQIKTLKQRNVKKQQTTDHTRSCTSLFKLTGGDFNNVYTAAYEWLKGESYVLPGPGKKTRLRRGKKHPYPYKAVDLLGFLDENKKYMNLSWLLMGTESNNYYGSDHVAIGLTLLT